MSNHQLRIVLKPLQRANVSKSHPKGPYKPKKLFRQWSQQDMNDAYNDVRGGFLTISKASRVYDVPRKTLSDRIHGNVDLHAKMGPSTALSTEEEASLVRYIEYMAGRGFPLTVDQACAFAWAIAKEAGKAHVFTENGPSEMWWRCFKGDILTFVSVVLIC
jgi:hypothetical protein